MTPVAVRKAAAILVHLRQIAACELLAAAQALEMRRLDRIRISPAARRAFDMVRSAVPMLDDDRPQVDDIEAISALIGSGAFAAKD